MANLGFEINTRQSYDNRLDLVSKRLKYQSDHARNVATAATMQKSDPEYKPTIGDGLSPDDQINTILDLEEVEQEALTNPRNLDEAASTLARVEYYKSRKTYAKMKERWGHSLDGWRKARQLDKKGASDYLYQDETAFTDLGRSISGMRREDQAERLRDISLSEPIHLEAFGQRITDGEGSRVLGRVADQAVGVGKTAVQLGELAMDVVSKPIDIVSNLARMSWDWIDEDTVPTEEEFENEEGYHLYNVVKDYTGSFQGKTTKMIGDWVAGSAGNYNPIFKSVFGFYPHDVSQRKFDIKPRSLGEQLANYAPEFVLPSGITVAFLRNRAKKMSARMGQLQLADAADGGHRVIDYIKSQRAVRLPLLGKMMTRSKQQSAQKLHDTGVGRRLDDIAKSEERMLYAQMAGGLTAATLFPSLGPNNSMMFGEMAGALGAGMFSKMMGWAVNTTTGGITSAFKMEDWTMPQVMQSLNKLRLAGKNTDWVANVAYNPDMFNGLEVYDYAIEGMRPLTNTEKTFFKDLARNLQLPENRRYYEHLQSSMSLLQRLDPDGSLGLIMAADQAMNSRTIRAIRDHGHAYDPVTTIGKVNVGSFVDIFKERQRDQLMAATTAMMETLTRSDLNETSRAAAVAIHADASKQLDDLNTQYLPVEAINKAALDEVDNVVGKVKARAYKRSVQGDINNIATRTDPENFKSKSDQGDFVTEVRRTRMDQAKAKGRSMLQGKVDSFESDELHDTMVDALNKVFNTLDQNVVDMSLAHGMLPLSKNSMMRYLDDMRLERDFETLKISGYLDHLNAARRKANPDVEDIADIDDFRRLNSQDPLGVQGTLAQANEWLAQKGITSPSIAFKFEDVARFMSVLSGALFNAEKKAASGVGGAGLAANGYRDLLDAATVALSKHEKGSVIVDFRNYWRDKVAKKFYHAFDGKFGKITSHGNLHISPGKIMDTLWKEIAADPKAARASFDDMFGDQAGEIMKALVMGMHRKVGQKLTPTKLAKLRTEPRSLEGMSQTIRDMISKEHYGEDFATAWPELHAVSEDLIGSVDNIELKRGQYKETADKIEKMGRRRKDRLKGEADVARKKWDRETRQQAIVELAASTTDSTRESRTFQLLFEDQAGKVGKDTTVLRNVIDSAPTTAAKAARKARIRSVFSYRMMNEILADGAGTVTAKGVSFQPKIVDRDKLLVFWENHKHFMEELYSKDEMEKLGDFLDFFSKQEFDEPFRTLAGPFKALNSRMTMPMIQGRVYSMARHKVALSYLVGEAAARDFFNRKGFLLTYVLSDPSAAKIIGKISKHPHLIEDPANTNLLMKGYLSWMRNQEMPEDPATPSKPLLDDMQESFLKSKSFVTGAFQ